MRLRIDPGSEPGHDREPRARERLCNLARERPAGLTRLPRADHRHRATVGGAEAARDEQQRRTVLDDAQVLRVIRVRERQHLIALGTPRLERVLGGGKRLIRQQPELLLEHGQRRQATRARRARGDYVAGPGAPALAQQRDERGGLRSRRLSRQSA
jgi:hypothetical protein